MIVYNNIIDVKEDNYLKYLKIRNVSLTIISNFKLLYLFFFILAFSKLIGNGDSNQNKLIRQISNTLSLQIELNDQKIPISLKLINKDNEKKNDEKDELSVNSIDYRPLSEQLNIANEINSIQSLNNNSINKLNQNKIEGNYRGNFF